MPIGAVSRFTRRHSPKHTRENRREGKCGKSGGNHIPWVGFGAELLNDSRSNHMEKGLRPTQQFGGQTNRDRRTTTSIIMLPFAPTD